MTALGRLHVLTDPGRGHLAVARPALRGGAQAIQLRDKRPVSDARLVHIARELSALVVRHGAGLIVNDRVGLAARCAADGVHLGPADATADQARRRLGEGAWIGRTVNDLGAVGRAASREITYYGVGPVRATISKARPSPVLGFSELGRIVRAVDRPVIAIGGLRPEHVAAVLDTGAFGVAVLSAVAGADDPERSTAAFREAIERWLDGRAA